MKKNNQGFTLIEVLVVVTIIMLMTGLIMTNYVTFAERNRVRTAAEEAQNFLADIQNRARMGHRGENPDALGSSGCAVEVAEQALTRPLIGWVVELRDNTMTARAICEAPGAWGATINFSEPLVRYLPQNTSFVHEIDQPIFIEFPGLYANPRFDVDIDIVIVDTNRAGLHLNNHFYSFMVSSGGAISSGGFCNMDTLTGVCIPI